LARFKTLHPTALIFRCTFVCDARCEMCSNWKRGDRKSHMILEAIEHYISSPSWHRIENANVSGGEPTTRNDLVDICRAMLYKLSRLPSSD
jgi:molybdenum cofactor biosynthesis enzyme MoaA